MAERAGTNNWTLGFRNHLGRDLVSQEFNGEEEFNFGEYHSPASSASANIPLAQNTSRRVVNTRKRIRENYGYNPNNLNMTMATRTPPTKKTRELNRLMREYSPPRNTYVAGLTPNRAPSSSSSSSSAAVIHLGINNIDTHDPNSFSNAELMALHRQLDNANAKRAQKQANRNRLIEPAPKYFGFQIGRKKGGTHRLVRSAKRHRK